MRGLPPSSFPRLDSYDVEFLGKAWGIVGGAICEWVKNIFAGGTIDPEFNNTLLVLIPRSQVLKIDSEIASAGGVLCDRNGNWILGYNCYLGQCSVFDVELWGILDGLALLQGCGEDNQDTDHITKMASDEKEGLQVFEDPPREMLAILYSNKV
ncbi:hypothetical protein Golax_000158, partial [Gossypium laxum]|nr:hypothetical protein [Gossypium laxum]